MLSFLISLHLSFPQNCPCSAFKSATNFEVRFISFLSMGDRILAFYFVFAYFSNSISNPGYKSSKDRMISNELKGCGRKRSRPNLKH
jgi:hypothetical protein